jgi:hypothetical protein
MTVYRLWWLRLRFEAYRAKGYDLSIKEGRQKVIVLADGWRGGDHSDDEVRVRVRKKEKGEKGESQDLQRVTEVKRVAREEQRCREKGNNWGEISRVDPQFTR